MKDSTTNTFDTANSNAMLCDGFLIPMTDFVNNVGNMENYPSHEKALCWIYNYAKFLKQPLKLEMFVPCVNGEPIEFHEGKVLSIAKVGSELLKEAKEKVLFELNSPVAVETMNYHISRNRNIEYLANFGSIKLTQNSLSAIFG